MSEDTYSITIKGVNSNDITVGPDKDEHWIVPFQLSQPPDDAWVKRFYEVQDNDRNLLKRKARVLNDILKTEVSGADDLQKILDVLKIEVVETNVLREKDYQKKLKIRQELEALQKRRMDATQQFKTDAEKLVF